MAIRKDLVKIDNKDLYKIWSDNYVKIQCQQDMNIYQVAYITLSSSYTFQETNIPIDQTFKVQANEVLGLSGYISQQTENNIIAGTYDESLSGRTIQTISSNNELVVDILDGKKDNEITINGKYENKKFVSMRYTC